jgi:serine/threonine protein phosphatase 1
MTQSRLFAIPDIHGRLDLLNKLLDILFTTHLLDLAVDKLVFMGDMIDRGPQSKQVLDKIRELEANHPDNVIVLAGNHEWLAIDAYINPTEDNQYLWHRNGGIATLESFGVYTDKNPSGPYGMGDAGWFAHGKLPEDYVRWMAKLPLKHEEPGFFFSHAPVPRENRRNIMWRGTKDFSKSELTWTYDRDEFGIARVHDNGVIGVCGHIHQLDRGVIEPRFYDHYIFADAGCGCSDRAPLVAIEVNTREVIYARP